MRIKSMKNTGKADPSFGTYSKQMQRWKSRLREWNKSLQPRLVDRCKIQRVGISSDFAVTCLFPAASCWRCSANCFLQVPKDKTSEQVEKKLEGLQTEIARLSQGHGDVIESNWALALFKMTNMSVSMNIDENLVGMFTSKSRPTRSDKPEPWRRHRNSMKQLRQVSRAVGEAEGSMGSISTKSWAAKTEGRATSLVSHFQGWKPLSHHVSPFLTILWYWCF